MIVHYLKCVLHLWAARWFGGSHRPHAVRGFPVWIPAGIPACGKSILNVVFNVINCLFRVAKNVVSQLKHCPLTSTLITRFIATSLTVPQTCSQAGRLHSSGQTQSLVSEVLPTGAGGEEAAWLRGPFCHQRVPVSTSSKGPNYNHFRLLYSKLLFRRIESPRWPLKSLHEFSQAITGVVL